MKLSKNAERILELAGHLTVEETPAVAGLLMDQASVGRDAVQLFMRNLDDTNREEFLAQCEDFELEPPGDDE